MLYELPSQFKDLAREYPNVCKAFENLGTDVMKQALWMKRQEGL